MLLEFESLRLRHFCFPSDFLWLSVGIDLRPFVKDDRNEETVVLHPDHVNRLSAKLFGPQKTIPEGMIVLRGEPLHSEVDILGLTFRFCQTGAEEQYTSGAIFLGDGTDEGQACIVRHRAHLPMALSGLLTVVHGIQRREAVSFFLFDFDKNGFKELSHWMSDGDGVLVMDRNGDGVVNDGTELFGDRTPLPDGTTARTGFEALATLDENGDGVVDALDGMFSSLKVWVDTNGDGISTSDELSFWFMCFTFMCSYALIYVKIKSFFGKRNRLELGRANGSDAVTRRPGQTTNSCGRARSDPPRYIEISRQESCFALFLQNKIGRRFD